MQVSVAAVEGDVTHVPHHDVLHANIILPEGRKGKKRKNECDEGEAERNLSSGLRR